MTRAEVLLDFKIDERSVILTKGMFEAEMIYAPYFHAKIMAGEGDEVVDPGGNGYSTFFEVTEEDRAEFPELVDVKRVECFQSTDGFFYCVTEP